MNGEVDVAEALGPAVQDRTDASVDVGIDAGARSRRRRPGRVQGGVLVVIALGGGFGSLARYGLAELLPTTAGRFPWNTFAANVAGCFLIGVLMVLITEVWAAHRLVRPLLGVGFLGGFTTFSTYAVETRALLTPDTVALAFAYLAGTLICALLATIGGVWLTRFFTRELERNH